MNGFNLQTVVNFILAIKWQSVCSILFGAVISAFISYKFTKWRENQRLRIDIQIKTADLLIDTVNNFRNASASMISSNFISFKNYNTALQYNQTIEGETDAPLDVTRDINKLKWGQIEQAKENVRKNYNDYYDRWQTYSKAFFPIISILESKEVILNKFIRFRCSRLDEFQKLSEMKNDFVTLYHFDITKNVINSQAIDEVSLRKVDEYQQKFMEKCVKISGIMWDLQVDLQNEFLSKLFNYTVPKRQPQDKTIPVYKQGFVYDVNNESKI